MNNYLKSAIDNLYGANDDFILIGLTGRTGSGCSTVGEILGLAKQDLKHSLYPGLNPKSNDERKNRILNRLVDQLWESFRLIQVRSVITLMLIEGDEDAVEEYISRRAGGDALKRKRIRWILKASFGLIKNKRDAGFYTKVIVKISESIKRILGPGLFVSLYQEIGINIRRSGNPLSSVQVDGNFFKLADRINQIAKDIREEDKESGRGTYLVIDAIRSPLEAIYFQKRYSSFYLMAVACSDSQRKERLRKLNYSEEQIWQIDRQEGEGRAVKDEDFFTVQDIPSCLERADIYLSNPDAITESEKFSILTNSIIKFVCLMRRPGIVQPSAMERCMQIAYVAKINSGCISRQVGAVVTDANFSVKAIGWNDVPAGQVPCSLRNRFDLELGRDMEAFSFYEKNDPEFHAHMKSSNQKFFSIKATGRNVSFCFKSEFNSLKKEKNQVHTRALHAEENAFLQLVKNGGMGVVGGYLFTTASPCELCSKKAYQLGIRKIFYVDPYPGISVDHILNSGSNKPEMHIFNGAVGKAYHRIYSQITPHKDELEALKS